MNKATKGLIAGVAGIGLLSGGATFALWSDQETIMGGTVTAGELDISKVAETRTWTDLSDGGAGTPITNPETFLIVPGDTIQVSEDLKIELEGNNLEARVVVDAPGLSGDLAPFLKAEYTVLFGDNVVESGSLEGDTFAGFSPIDVGTASDGNVYTVQIRVIFPSETQNQDGVGLSAVLADTVFTLEQTP